MSNPAIKVEHLGKRYKLGGLEPYKTLRDTIANCFSSNKHEHASEEEKYHWALQDVNFEVKEGEVLGIIGKNGAGKSTLLKILSRITSPTEGQVAINGRIAALLEVGTGFHLELTGRENIFLNGSVLGMSRADIKLKFDEIVAFAGVEKYLDTPVKRYSSGMKVRLAFAVAAHLEPEILIIDEVLAVGDAEFQKKCLGRMHDVSTEGRTVLFVSHQMEAVKTLCSRAVQLSGGTICNDGAPQDVITNYLSDLDTLAEINDQTGVQKTKNDIAIKKFSINENKDGHVTIALGEEMNCVLEISNFTKHSINCNIRVQIRDYSDNVITFFSTSDSLKNLELKSGENHISLKVPRIHLVPSRYRINISIRSIITGELLERVHTAAIVDILAGNLYDSDSLIKAGKAIYLEDHQWSNT